MSHRQAFTLIELLVVVAIIGVLAGILFPVVAGVRRRSKQTVCISNLHQCSVAIKLYMDDNETNVPPDDTMTRQLMEKVPTCCPNDTEWSKGCTQQFGLPFIGSYAYTRSIPVWKDAPYQDVSAYYNNTKMVWMVDIFHGSQIPAPYYAGKETIMQYAERVTKSNQPDDRTMVPNSMLMLYDDGSVKTIRTNSRYIMMWQPIFMYPQKYFHEDGS